MYDMAILIMGSVLFVIAMLSLIFIKTSPRDIDDRVPPNPTPATTVCLAAFFLHADPIESVLKICLIDLASRGHIRLIYDNSWTISPLSPLDDKAFSHERFLYDTLVYLAGDEHTSIDYAQVRSKCLKEFERLIESDIADLGWFAQGKRFTYSHWGWIGSLVVILGLLVSASMLISWLAIHDFRGVIGGLLMIAAGLILASHGRQRRRITESGRAVERSIAALRTHLVHMRPEQICLASICAQFSSLIPLAIQLGNGDQIGAYFDTAIARAQSWQRDERVDTSWVTFECKDSSLHQVAIMLNDFYSNAPGR